MLAEDPSRAEQRALLDAAMDIMEGMGGEWENARWDAAYLAAKQRAREHVVACQPTWQRLCACQTALSSLEAQPEIWTDQEAEEIWTLPAGAWHGVLPRSGD